jgi:hypothetical protein
MGLHHPSAGDWHHLGRYGDCMFFWTCLMLQWRFFLNSHVLVQYLSHAYFHMEIVHLNNFNLLQKYWTCLLAMLFT